MVSVVSVFVVSVFVASVFVASPFAVSVFVASVFVASVLSSLSLWNRFCGISLCGLCSPALAYTIAYRPCAPRLLTLWARAGPGAQGQ